MNTHDIGNELPAEFRSGNDIPVTQATIKRERMEEILRAAIEANRKRGTAKQRYDAAMDGCNETDPIERLRFYCSLAMSGQDWLDVEPFFDSLIADRQRRGEPVAWQPIETAPKDGPIIAYCNHEADPHHTDEPGGCLTLYAAHYEGLSHCETGIHIVEWGGAWDDRTYEDSSGGFMPDWWFVAGSGFEVAANPTHWIPLPVFPNAASQPAEPVQKAQKECSKVAERSEPVQVPSDKEIGQVLDEVRRNSLYGELHWGLWLEFARALLARYAGERVSRTSDSIHGGTNEA